MGNVVGWIPVAHCSLTLQNCNCGFVVRKSCLVILYLSHGIDVCLDHFLICLYILIYSGGDSFQLELFEFDHIHFDSSLGSPVAILYGAIGTDCFKEFHSTLVEAAKEVCNLLCRYSLLLSYGHWSNVLSLDLFFFDE